MTRLPKDFKEFLGLLNSKQIEHLVAGVCAAAFYIYPRATGDMDIRESRHKDLDDLEHFEQRKE